MELNVLLLLIITALVIYILRLHSQLSEYRWVQRKVLPWMLEAARQDPEEREYLDPESLKAYARGEITIDEVQVLAKVGHPPQQQPALPT